MSHRKWQFCNCLMANDNFEIFIWQSTISDSQSLLFDSKLSILELSQLTNVTITIDNCQFQINNFGIVNSKSIISELSIHNRQLSIPSRQISIRSWQFANCQFLIDKCWIVNDSFVFPVDICLFEITNFGIVDFHN